MSATIITETVCEAGIDRILDVNHMQTSITDVAAKYISITGGFIDSDVVRTLYLRLL